MTTSLSWSYKAHLWSLAMKRKCCIQLPSCPARSGCTVCVHNSAVNRELQPGHRTATQLPSTVQVYNCTSGSQNPFRYTTVHTQVANVLENQSPVKCVCVLLNYCPPWKNVLLHSTNCIWHIYKLKIYFDSLSYMVVRGSKLMHLDHLIHGLFIT
jgi:hypothetical protein